MATKKTIQYNIPVIFLREGKKFIAYTPALDLSTTANSYAKAKERFNEIVEIFFEELIRKNTLKEVLENFGWHKMNARWKPPVVIAQESETVTVNQ